MMVAMLTYPFTKNKNINILLKILTKKQKLYSQLLYYMYNENCRNLEIILSILLFTSEGTGSAIRGGNTT